MISVPQKVKDNFLSDYVINELHIFYSSPGPNSFSGEIPGHLVNEETFSFTESMCSKEKLKLGSVEASFVSFDCREVGDLTDYELLIYFRINLDGDIREICLGRFIVDTCKRDKDDPEIRHIEGYSKFADNEEFSNPISLIKYNKWHGGQDFIQNIPCILWTETDNVDIDLKIEELTPSQSSSTTIFRHSSTLFVINGVEYSTINVSWTQNTYTAGNEYLSAYKLSKVLTKEYMQTKKDLFKSVMRGVINVANAHSSMANPYTADEIIGFFETDIDSLFENFGSYINVSYMTINASTGWERYGIENENFKFYPYPLSCNISYNVGAGCLISIAGYAGSFAAGGENTKLERYRAFNNDDDRMNMYLETELVNEVQVSSTQTTLVYGMKKFPTMNIRKFVEGYIELRGCFGKFGRQIITSGRDIGKIFLESLESKNDPLIISDNLIISNFRKIKSIPARFKINPSNYSYFYCDEKDTKKYGRYICRFRNINGTEEVIEGFMDAEARNNPNKYAVYDFSENIFIQNARFNNENNNLYTLLNSALRRLRNVSYRPFEIEMQSMPWVEAGDSVYIEGTNDECFSYVLKRTIKGIKAPRDSITTM